MPPNTYWSPEVVLVEAISDCSADCPIFCRVAPEFALGVHVARSFKVAWALELIDAERGLRGRQAGRNEAVAAGQRLELADLLLERQLVAGLVAELQAEIGVLAGRFSVSPCERRLGLHDWRDEAAGQELGRNEVRGHRRHAACRRAENMLLTVVSSFAVVA